MSVSMSNIGTALARLGAENAIESGNANREIRRAGYDQNQAEKRQQGEVKDMQNDIKAVQGMISTAAQAVSVVQSVQKLGEATKDYSQYQRTQPELTRTTDRATHGTEAQQAQGLRELQGVRLSENTTVGERFNEHQLSLLMHPDRITSEEQLTQSPVGFTKAEAHELFQMKQEGKLNQESAVNWMWGHRKTESQSHHEQQTQALQSSLQKMAMDTMNQGFGQMQKNLGAQGKRAGERAEQGREVANTAHGQEVDHNAALGDIELQGLRQRRGANQTGGASANATSR